MHPHWYSSSPEIQRRLISHFLNSLAPQSAISPLSPTLSSPISAFESEVNFTRDPHDIATVLRWGLRHLQLEGDNFGTDDGWYKAFLDAESAAEYPPKAFSEKLAPNLPPAHLELLLATLEIFSSLAAHSEANSTNGSKLSKIFGLWLLTARRVEDKDDWQSFYSRWERTGRMLEHLFLARIRYVQLLCLFSFQFSELFTEMNPRTNVCPSAYLSWYASTHTPKGCLLPRRIFNFSLVPVLRHLFTMPCSCASNSNISQKVASLK